MVLTVTLPDGSTVTPALTEAPTGSYYNDYVPASAGHYTARFVGTVPSVAFTDSFDVDASIYAVSLDEMKAHLRITTSAQDEELRTFLFAATAAAESWCGRLFRRQTVVEVRSGGTSSILLDEGPALSITTVTESGTTLAASDYYLDGQTLTRRDGTYSAGCWLEGLGNVTVTYVAGMSTFPEDLRHGLKELVRHLWQTQRGNMPVPNQGPDDVYIPGLTYTFPRRVLELLSPYDLKPTLVR